MSNCPMSLASFASSNCLQIVVAAVVGATVAVAVVVAFAISFVS